MKPLLHRLSAVFKMLSKPLFPQAGPTEDEILDFVTAAANGNIVLLEKLYDRFKETILNERSGTGCTALSASILKDPNTECFDFLIAKKADVSLFYAGNTPLMSSAQCQRLHHMKTLLENGADARLFHELSLVTALELAVIAEFTEGIDLLISHNADINMKGIMKRTPLMEAAFRGYSDGVDRLLQAGANIFITDDMGRTAADLAREKDHPQLADTLHQRMAQEENALYLQGIEQKITARKLILSRPQSGMASKV